MCCDLATLDVCGDGRIGSAFPAGLHMPCDLIPEARILRDFNNEVVPAVRTMQSKGSLAVFSRRHIARENGSGVGVGQTNRYGLEPRFAPDKVMLLSSLSYEVRMSRLAMPAPEMLPLNARRNPLGPLTDRS